MHYPDKGVKALPERNRFATAATSAHIRSEDWAGDCLPANDTFGSYRCCRIRHVAKRWCQLRKRIRLYRARHGPAAEDRLFFLIPLALQEIGSGGGPGSCFSFSLF